MAKQKTARSAHADPDGHQITKLSLQNQHPTPPINTFKNHNNIGYLSRNVKTIKTTDVIAPAMKATYSLTCF